MIDNFLVVNRKIAKRSGYKSHYFKMNKCKNINRKITIITTTRVEKEQIFSCIFDLKLKSYNNAVVSVVIHIKLITVKYNHYKIHSTIVRGVYYKEPQTRRLS